jgi:Helix-turn-helix domain
MMMSAPTPEQIRAARERAGWSKEVAASMVLVSLRSWQSYEAGSRRIPLGTWMLFGLAAGTVKMEFQTDAGRAVVRRTIEGCGH